MFNPLVQVQRRTQGAGRVVQIPVYAHGFSELKLLDDFSRNKTENSDVDYQEDDEACTVTVLNTNFSESVKIFLYFLRNTFSFTPLD